MTVIRVSNNCWLTKTDSGIDLYYRFLSPTHSNILMITINPR